LGGLGRGELVLWRLLGGMAIWMLMAFYVISLISLTDARNDDSMERREDLLVIISWIYVYHNFLKLVSSFLPSAKSSLREPLTSKTLTGIASKNS
jgi:hypothetical protein